jgi:hypothetical protein
MRSFTIAALLALASVASAGTTISCDGYYPEPNSPEHSTIIASVVQNPDGSIASMSCDERVGDVNDPTVCDIGTGTCCPCNVSRGFTPECLATIITSDFSTRGFCLETYPGPYYGDSTSGAFVDVMPEAVVRHSKHRRHHGK